MKVTWIIEKFMFEEYEKQLCEIIKNSGHNVLLIDDTDWRFDFDRDVKNKFRSDDCVIFYGSLQRGRQMLRDTSLIPGVYLTVDNYECYKYYGYYGDKLVNHDYLMFGLNDVKRNKEKIFSYFKTSSVFIRPSNGYKTFTGQLLSYENFDEEFRVLCLSYGGLDLDQLVLVSSKKDVIEENRFVVLSQNGTNRIIDGNTYMVNRELVKERIYDDKSYEFALSVVDNYTPDNAFTIDIAKMSDGSYKVLEIGSFCCAGLYNMDLEKVVKEMNELVVNNYKEYNNIS